MGACAAADRSLIRFPTQPEWTYTWSSRTVPEGSRHTGSLPSGNSLRITWPTVQRTVATVGIPSLSYTAALPWS